MKQNWSALGLCLGLLGCGASQKGGPAQSGGMADMSAFAGESPTPEGRVEQRGADGEEDGDASPDQVTTASSSQLRMREGAEVKKESAPTVLPLPSGTKILHVGDSFAGALGLPLGQLLEGAGIKSVLKHTDSSYLTDWAWDGELQKMLWKYNPDLLIVTLGANELAIAEPEQRKKAINKIMSVVGDRPCLWVAIPLWDSKHNGLMDVIRSNMGSCVYWDSNMLIDVEHMPRISDGIHPTTQARADWAQVVFHWLKAHRAPTEGQVWALTP